MADEPEVLICSLTRCFADDRVLACMECGATVYVRPHSPLDIRRICALCFMRHRATHPNEPLTMRVTEESARELRALAIFQPLKKARPN